MAEYLIDLNATQAAIRAGYSKKTAKQQASRLLTNVDLQRTIAARSAAVIEKAELSAVRTLEELRRLAFTDVRAFFTADGSLKPVNEWTPEMGSQCASIETIIKNAQAGDGHTDTVLKFRLWSKERALEMLAKHFVLLTEVVQMKDDAERIRILHAGREQNARAEQADQAKVLEGGSRSHGREMQR